MLLVAASAAAGPEEPSGHAPEAERVEESQGSTGVWFSIGVLGGITQLSHGLADYQWDTTPRPSWGAEAQVGGRRISGGVRLWKARTTQGMDDLAPASSVRTTRTELVGEYRLARAWGAEVRASAAAGWLHVGYHPDQVAFQPSGGGSPIVVGLAPVDEWIAGGGVGLRRSLHGDWSMGIGVEASVFGLDSARRDGQTLVVGRESFSNWSARVELARLYRHR